MLRHSSPYWSMYITCLSSLKIMNAWSPLEPVLRPHWTMSIPTTKHVKKKKKKEGGENSGLGVPDRGGQLTQPWSYLAVIGRRFWCNMCNQHQSPEMYTFVACLRKVFPRCANTDWQGLGWSRSCHHRGKTIQLSSFAPKKELRYVRSLQCTDHHKTQSESLL